MQYSEFYFDYDLIPFVGYDVSDAVFQCMFSDITDVECSG